VETVARVSDAIAGPHPRDPSSLAGSPTTDATAGVDDPVDGLRVGVVEPAMAGADGAVADAVEAALARLDGAGVESESVSLPGFEAATAAGLTVAGTEFAALALAQGQVVGVGTGYSEPWRAAFSAAVASPDLGENVRAQILTNAAVSAEDHSGYVAARNLGSEFTATVDETLGHYDALVTPTTPMTAPTFGSVTTDADFARTVADTAPFNLSGHPALSVPADTESDPVGVQFVGARDDERTLVALGRALETAG
jgi:Asp-tRNA(Asn)/Glu-tRNA(Gln) amidotransferase A subunit family amidase